LEFPYIFNGLTTLSIKQGYQCREIEFKTNKVPFMITLVFVILYMTTCTEEIEKAFFLRRFNIPNG